MHIDILGHFKYGKNAWKLAQINQEGLLIVKNEKKSKGAWAVIWQYRNLDIFTVNTLYYFRKQEFIDKIYFWQFHAFELVEGFYKSVNWSSVFKQISFRSFFLFNDVKIEIM